MATKRPCSWRFVWLLRVPGGQAGGWCCRRPSALPLRLVVVRQWWPWQAWPEGRGDIHWHARALSHACVCMCVCVRAPEARPRSPCVAPGWGSPPLATGKVGLGPTLPPWHDSDARRSTRLHERHGLGTSRPAVHSPQSQVTTLPHCAWATSIARDGPCEAARYPLHTYPYLDQAVVEAVASRASPPAALLHGHGGRSCSAKQLRGTVYAVGSSTASKTSGAGNSAGACSIPVRPGRRPAAAAVSGPSHRSAASGTRHA